MIFGPFALAGLALISAAVVSMATIVLLLPALKRHMVATPTMRSSHYVPTPQGGGIAVVGAALAVSTFLLHFFAGGLTVPVLAVFATAVVIAGVGAVDDIFVLEVVPRLLLQAVCVAIVVVTLPAELRVLPALPVLFERALIFIGGIWFVNLINFMDGIDWITVAEVVPITGALAIFGFVGALPQDATITALALCGAMIGFAPFNRPVARLFLGDVGSLPIGLLLGWLLIQLASAHLTAALLLPLYYLADATITLFRRLMRGEPIVEAHRTHFYQGAMDGGFTVSQIVARIFAINLCLIVLAATTFVTDSRLAHGVAIATGCVVVGALLFRFATGKRCG
jgi:UDP-N-acetylmuramyl pentapeptide phosphotransferase/UDP-N-acetylglucosamine-1-phosphate transferase